MRLPYVVVGAAASTVNSTSAESPARAAVTVSAAGAGLHHVGAEEYT